MTKLAVVFPGQGSQAVGMLADFVEQHEIVKQTFQQATDILSYDLWDLIQKGPAEQLNQTVYTQVAMLVADIAVWRLWQNQTPQEIDYVAGHSLGEFAALVAAKVLSFEDALKLVIKRAELMQAAVPLGKGAMAVVIGLESAMVESLSHEQADNQVLAIANFNAPGQIVVAGQTPAVERFVTAAKEQQAKLVKLLPVSVPSHCQLMQPAAEEFNEYLQSFNFNQPTIPLIHNVDVCQHQTADAIKDALTRQLYSPVRWVETVEWLAKQAINIVVECGPNKVLTGLGKRIAPSLQHLSTNNRIAFEKLLTVLQETI